MAQKSIYVVGLTLLIQIITTILFVSPYKL